MQVRNVSTMPPPGLGRIRVGGLAAQPHMPRKVAGPITMGTWVKKNLGKQRGKQLLFWQPSLSPLPMQCCTKRAYSQPVKRL